MQHEIHEQQYMPRQQSQDLWQDLWVTEADMAVSNMDPIKAHENNKCLFCGESNGGRRHIERHMEEVAFTVVSIPYKEWEFYSDSSLKSYRTSRPND